MLMGRLRRLLRLCSLEGVGGVWHVGFGLCWYLVVMDIYTVLVTIEG
jgi:hypothetical protein